MWIRKNKFLKLIQEKNELKNRVEELEEILCPCGRHEFVIVDIDTTYPYYGGQTVEILQTRKLKCRKCKKVVYDYNGCGNSYKYEVSEND